MNEWWAHDEYEFLTERLIIMFLTNKNIFLTNKYEFLANKNMFLTNKICF